MFNFHPLDLISKPDALLFTFFLPRLAFKRFEWIFWDRRVVHAYESCLLDSSPAVNVINPDSMGFAV